MAKKCIQCGACDVKMSQNATKSKKNAQKVLTNAEKCDIMVQKGDNLMDEKNWQPIPFAVYQAAGARFERTITKLWVLVIILIVLFVGTNCAWLWHNSQYEIVDSWEITQETQEGDNNYVGNDSEVTYGKTND